MNKCPFDPKTLAGLPIGMLHCPECGEMVLAGMEHPPSLNEFEKCDCKEGCGKCAGTGLILPENKQESKLPHRLIGDK